MIYRGKEKENHRGSLVKYQSGGKQYVGILLEPVNYQIVVTKEHGLCVLSAGGPSEIREQTEEVKTAFEKVYTGDATEDDYYAIKEWLNNRNIREVESVVIYDADLITDEEAEECLLKLTEKLEKQSKHEGVPPDC